MYERIFNYSAATCTFRQIFRRSANYNETKLFKNKIKNPIQRYTLHVYVRIVYYGLYHYRIHIGSEVEVQAGSVGEYRKPK